MGRKTMSAATDPGLLAGQRKQIQALAADRGRQPPAGISLGARVTIAPGPAGEQDRRSFQGNLEQVTRDAIRFTQAVPATDLLMSLPGSVTNVRQRIDTAATLHAALRAAGI
jgi:hypothetical protein